MHPPSKAQGPPSEGRDWRGRNDGGNNASADTDRTDAVDANRAVRHGCADDNGSFGIFRRLLRARNRVYQPLEYPPRTGAARFLALTRHGNALAGSRRQGRMRRHPIPSNLATRTPIPEARITVTLNGSSRHFSRNCHGGAHALRARGRCIQLNPSCRSSAMRRGRIGSS
jgi:hypothetical protein